jgi:hypothetical protein
VGVLVAGAGLLITFSLYSLPAPLARIAERLASVRRPFSATNDQLAIITWFQESAPPDGYGLGAVPWCGEILARPAAAACPGRSRATTCSRPWSASTARPSPRHWSRCSPSGWCAW